jgi:hypothetical protein
VGGSHKGKVPFFFFWRDPIYLQSAITFSKWWEGWRISCRRVLSSTPLLVRGSETGGDSGEYKFTNYVELTNKKYN